MFEGIKQMHPISHFTSSTCASQPRHKLHVQTEAIITHFILHVPTNLTLKNNLRQVGSFTTNFRFDQIQNGYYIFIKFPKTT